MSEDIIGGHGLATYLFKRLGKYRLEWEVIGEAFSVLIEKFKVKPEDILYAINCGLDEWDV